MRRYNLYNDILGWFCFAVAALTYLLTLEPTASFWDCPEFISQAYKLEVGHPPGNPIFMIAGRFFVNFAGGDVTKVALMVNIMSALLSAGTILLLFWTITHFTRRLIVRGSMNDVTIPQMLAIYGSGLCGALMYTWSDTFWFSAVEGEVYAFSSFCTALVVWLILKWENRADQPGSDRYLILIAYVIGISIAVHLLNLLCIPAIALVVYYRKFANTTARGSLLTILVSALIIALILFGLVPGFIGIAQYFEIFFVNTLGTSYNIGVLVYVIMLVGTLIWAIKSLYDQKNILSIRLAFFVSVLLSGIPFLGGNITIGLLLLVVLALWLWRAKKLPVRVMTITALSILVMFIGYSSYALLLIRSGANPPMNQNAPDNVFALGSYLNREQYGESPLLYGQTFVSTVQRTPDGVAYTTPGKAEYAKVVKTDDNQSDQYILKGNKTEYHWTPNMLFPRMYSQSPNHPEGYMSWGGISTIDMDHVPVYPYVDNDGNPITEYEQTGLKPTAAQNMRYFINYQLIHMYWRYFMWNFAGRQNDLQSQGEPNKGNWISGIPFIDNPRLGDQSLLPDDIGKNNKGHNVFYMLPLFLGIIGLCWQAFVSKKGIEQFWVVFFLFFMTGIAIVLYLNQPPYQPRERDYAFAGSFYAYAIWVGMGVAAIWSWLNSLAADKKNGRKEPVPERKQMLSAVAACLVGILIPLQVVSQTWDDHDRSGRYTTRDFGMNYLSSVDQNGIIFTNGDNDTFPLWYAQEVEGYRTDVRVVNMSYLTTDWYADQLRYPYYDSPAVDMLAKPENYAYDRLQVALLPSDDQDPQDALKVLDNLYANTGKNDISTLANKNVFIPVDIEQAVKAGVIGADEAASAQNAIVTQLPGNSVYLSGILALDMLATSAKNGWNRPVYFALTVPEDYYLGLQGFMRNTGLAYQVTPIYTDTDGYSMGVDTEKMYRNVMENFRWGGLDKLGDNGKIYLDETVRRMVTTHRSSLVDLATALYSEGFNATTRHERYLKLKTTDEYAKLDEEQKKQIDDIIVQSADSVKNNEFAADRYKKAVEVLNLMMEKLPVKHSPLSIQMGLNIAELYIQLGEQTADKQLVGKGKQILADEILRYAQYIPYYNNLKRNGLFEGLTRSDKYIPTYIEQMIKLYASAGGDLNKLATELADEGIKISDLVQVQQDKE